MSESTEGKHEYIDADTLKTARERDKAEVTDGKCSLCNGPVGDVAGKFCQDCGATFLTEEQISDAEELLPKE